MKGQAITKMCFSLKLIYSCPCCLIFLDKVCFEGHPAYERVRELARPINPAPHMKEIMDGLSGEFKLL
jgi:hypothetical protein